MAHIVLQDAHLTVNAVDLSDHIASVSVDLEQDNPEDTSMGATSKAFIAGLKSGGFQVTFRADYAAGETDATLWGIYSGNAAVAFTLKPNGAATSTSNPAYTGSCLLQDYQPISGSVGDVAAQPATFITTGDVSRATS